MALSSGGRAATLSTRPSTKPRPHTANPRGPFGGFGDQRASTTTTPPGPRPGPGRCPRTPAGCLRDSRPGPCARGRPGSWPKGRSPRPARPGPPRTKGAQVESKSASMTSRARAAPNACTSTTLPAQPGYTHITRRLGGQFGRAQMAQGRVQGQAGQPKSGEQGPYGKAARIPPAQTSAPAPRAKPAPPLPGSAG